MNTPYFNTFLYSRISLHPTQMDNDMYKHLKNNLIRKLQGKCYKNYGLISKIYKIEERIGGEIIAEDPTASATYKVKFSCKLCRPLKGTTIVCEVMEISRALIHFRNGPVHMLIFEGQGYINQDNFIFDEKRNVLLAKVGNGKGVPIISGTFVDVKVLGFRIEHKSKRIVIIGTLEGLSSKKAIDESIKQREEDLEEFIEYDDYTKIELPIEKKEDDEFESESHKSIEKDEGEESEESDFDEQ